MDLVHHSPDVIHEHPRALRRLGHSIVRWRTPLVVGPLLVGLVVAGGLGAQMMLGRAPAPVGVAATVTCWNATEVLSADDCSAPTGKAGLAWVFPSLRPERPGCVNDRKAEPDLPRPTQFTCTVRAAGRTAQVTYYQMADLQAGQRFTNRVFGRESRQRSRGDGGQVERFVWRRRVDSRFELVSTYVGHPYGVTVVAPERGVRERAFRTVRFRAPETLTVRPSA